MGESYGWYTSLGAIFDGFVWKIARLGSGFSFNFTISHARAANNSLTICERLERYLKES